MTDLTTYGRGLRAILGHGVTRQARPDAPAPGTCAAVQAAAERRRTDHALVGHRVAAALIEAHGDEVLRVIAASLRDHLQGSADLDSMRGAGL